MTYLFSYEASRFMVSVIDELDKIASDLEKKEEWTISRKLEIIKDEIRTRCIEDYAQHEL